MRTPAAARVAAGDDGLLEGVGHVLMKAVANLQGDPMFRAIQLSALAACAAFLAVAAHAGPGEPAGVKSGKTSTESITTSHKLLKSYFDTDNTSVNLVVGSNPVGTALTLNCGNAAGCTIAANMNAQLAAAATENKAAICMKVDGASVNCPFNGIIRAGSGFQVMNYQTFTSVTAGNHTVEMDVFSSVATSMIRWNKEIKIYKP
jgi:hypothetical protein